MLYTLENAREVRRGGRIHAVFSEAADAVTYCRWKNATPDATADAGADQGKIAAVRDRMDWADNAGRKKGE